MTLIKTVFPRKRRLTAPLGQKWSISGITIRTKDIILLKTLKNLGSGRNEVKNELRSSCYCRLIHENICKAGWRMVHWSPLLTNGYLQHRDIAEI